MATQKVVGALMARSAALSAGARPADASRAAVIATMFANPVAGAVVGRALARKSDTPKPSDKPSSDDSPGDAPDGDSGSEERRALTQAIRELAEAGKAIAKALEESVKNQNAVLERLAKMEQDRAGQATFATSPASPSSGLSAPTSGGSKPPAVTKKSP